MSDNDSINEPPLTLTPKQKWPKETIELPATTRDIDEFIQWRIQVYSDNEYNNSDLSEYYTGDFANFDDNAFKIADKEVQRALRNFLRRNGVYVQIGRGFSIVGALLAAIKEELPWPDDDADRPEPTRATVQTQPQTQQRVPSSIFMSPVEPIQQQQQTPLTGGNNTRVRDVEPAQQAVRFEPDAQYQGGVRLEEDSRYPSLSRYPSIVNRRTASNLRQEQTIPIPQPRQTSPVQLPESTHNDIYNDSPDIPIHRPRAIRPIRPQTPPAASWDQTHQRPPPPQPFQATQTDPNRPTQADYSRQIANLAKMYTDEDKYSPSDDSFGYKLSIFCDNCAKAGVPREAQGQAFSMMLVGLAKDFYYNSCRSIQDIDQLADAICKRFETREQGRLTLLRWNTLSLDEVIRKNPDQPMVTCLNILIKEMTSIRRQLPAAYHTDQILCDQLINACRANYACRFACYKAGDTLTSIISDLQASIATYEQTKRTPDTFTTDPELYESDVDDTYYVDRRYRGPSRAPPKPKPYPTQQRRRYQSRDQAKKCLVCQRYGCWSTNHTPAERQEAAAKMKQRFDRGYRQYISELEGDSGLDELDDSEVFQAWVKEPPQKSDDTDKPTDSTTFFTTCGSVNSNQGYEMIQTLNNQTIQHALTQSTDNITDVVTTYTLTRYSNDCFAGVLIDTGSAKVSTAGERQYNAYIKAFGDTALDQSTSGSVSIQFGIGKATSIGSVQVYMPIGTATFHVMPTDTPFLLCLQDMDRMGVYYNNIRDAIIHPKGSHEVVRSYGHPFIIWGMPAISYLTEPELRQLHRRFGHPSVERLAKVLNRAGHDEPSNYEAIQKISRFYTTCQKHGQDPRRFKFALHKDIEFNHTVYVDVMYIDSSLVLHVVDEATKFQAARWLENMTSQHTCDILRLCWIDTYLGPPDLIVHDAGTNFTGTEFN